MGVRSAGFCADCSPALGGGSRDIDWPRSGRLRSTLCGSRFYRVILPQVDVSVLVRVVVYNY